MTDPNAALATALAAQGIAATAEQIASAAMAAGITLTSAADEVAREEWERKFRSGELSVRKIIGA